VRRIIQLLFLGFFIYLFFSARYPLTSFIPVDLFLRADPLVALITSLASRELVPHLLLPAGLLLLTLVLGRFFCGYLCPLGTVLDLSSRLFSRARLRFAERLRNLKVYLLIGLVAAALAGANLAYLFDPISILTRTCTILVYPLTVLFANLSLDVLRPAAREIGWIGLTYLSFDEPLFSTGIITAVIFIGIVMLNLITPRFWCRYLCPLGALLGLFSRFGIFKRVVNNQCSGCAKCQATCPMGAITDDPRTVKAAECLQCRTCRFICPTEAISFKAIYSPFREDATLSLDMHRRGFLLACSSGLATSYLFTRDPLARIRSDTLIRPPGALPEADFLATCIRCGVCMKACITNTLQPALLDCGVEGLFTPKALLRYAACEQTCNLCGKVCPTQAIRNLELEEKKYARMGTAVILKEKCLVWEQDKTCLICDEQCPYNAIVFKVAEGFRRPFVIENKCNGCGFCEHACPVEGGAAIVVTPLGEVRLAEGSYREAALANDLTLEEDKGYDDFILEGESPSQDNSTD